MLKSTVFVDGALHLAARHAVAPLNMWLVEAQIFAEKPLPYIKIVNFGFVKKLENKFKIDFLIKTKTTWRQKSNLFFIYCSFSKNVSPKHFRSDK